MNPSLELSNALPNEQAQMGEAEQLLNRLQCLDLDAYQAEYLNAWRGFYTDHQHYLFPDDRSAQEYEPPRSEDVSALSYERTAEAIKQTRLDVLQGNKERLNSTLFTATSPTTRRHKLAHECYNTAERLKRYEADVFTDLTAAIYTPCLPPIYSSLPERRVDEPATVGAALGLLDFLAYVCAEYKTSQLPIPTTAPPAAIPMTPSNYLRPCYPETPKSPAATPMAPSPAAEPFKSLLLNYTLAELTALLGELGLLNTATGRATPAASSGAWVGIIYALLEAKRPRLRGSKAAIWRAFSQTFEAAGSERAVQYGLGGRDSEAETFRDRALTILNK